MSERMKKDELLQLADSLKISKEEFTILSSGALVIRGILEDAGDLDIAVTKQGFKELNENYNLAPKGNGWFIVSDKVECVPDEMEGKKEKVGDYFIQDIHDYLKYLESSSREKDKMRIPKVIEYIENK